MIAFYSKIFQLILQCILLNQDQDELGGGFESHQSFSGSLSELNWFKKKLTTEQVKEIFNNGVGISVPSSLQEHLILDWSEVVKLPLEGAVTLQNEILREGESDKTTSYQYYNRKRGNCYPGKAAHIGWLHTE